MSATLQTAIQGGKIPDSKKSSLLTEALDKVKSVKNQLSRAKEVSETIADAAIATAETQGTVFAATFAEGYFGEAKMDLGPVDIRLGGGLLVGGYGLYQAMSGKGVGTHALAIGNGLLAAGIGRIGRQAGKALAEKKEAGAAPPAAPAAAPVPPPAPAVPQLKGDDIGEIARMVRMTPGTEGEDVAGRRRAMARRGRDDDAPRRGFIRERH